MFRKVPTTFSVGLRKPAILGKPHSEGNQPTWTLTAKGTRGPEKEAGRIGMGNRKDTHLGLQGNENPPFEGGRGQQGQLIQLFRLCTVQWCLAKGTGGDWNPGYVPLAKLRLWPGAASTQRKGGHLFLILPKAQYGLSADKVMFWKPKWASHQKTNII